MVLPSPERTVSLRPVSLIGRARVLKEGSGPASIGSMYVYLMILSFWNRQLHSIATSASARFFT